MQMRPRFLGAIAAIAAIAAIYVFVAKLGLMLDAVSGFATLVWGPSGIALSALLLLGFRMWPGVWLGAFVVNLWMGAPWPVAVGIAVGNTLEAVVGAYALRRLAGFQGSFDRLRHVMGLLLPAAVGSTLISATIGVASLWLGGIVTVERLRATWSAWWVGDMLGDLVVAPLLLTWSRPFEKRIRPASFIEALLLLASLMGVGTLVFLTPVEASPYLLFPLFIWAALRFELRGASAATVVASVFAVWGTVRGSGPFVRERLAESLFALQTFMGCAALTPLVVGGAISDRARAVRTRESLVAAVSHELQNPLGAIRLSATSLTRGLPDVTASRVEKHKQLVQRNVDRMLRLVRDLLDAAAIDAGLMSVDLRPESAAAIAAEAVELLGPLAAAKKQDLKVSSAHDLQVCCDRQRILQVFSNLVGNAIKFSEEGRPISVRVERAGGAACFSVQDAGPGIEPGQLGHAFERYWHATASKGGGTGLGLFLAKGIVEAHGGTIRVDSKVGRGTTFHFTVPLSSALASRSILRGEPSPSDALDVDSSPISILEERALRESERRKAAVIEGALDCIITMDHEGSITEFNPAAEKTFGYARSDVIGKPLAELIIPPALRQAHRAGLERYLATGEAPVIGKRIELTAMRADGTEFPVELVVTSRASQRSPSFTGFLRDLTEQKRVEAALVKSEARFRRLLDAGIIGIITADLRGNILDANATFLDMVGYTCEEVRAGKVRWADMTPPNWRHLDELAIEQLRATGVASPWEKEYVRKDGARVSVLFGVAMLDDKIEECIAFVLDISHRKEAEAAIDRLRREREADLEVSVQVRDDFLAIASHELKTPLAALLMHVQGCQRVLRREPVAASFRERLGKAESSGLRLEKLIDQLLDVSRITGGHLRLEPSLVNLGDVVREVVARRTDPNAAVACPVVLRCEPQVWGRWDRLRMDQVVDNLVANALKYGQGKPVEVDLHIENCDAIIGVRDHGIGIDKDHQEKIFQRFERAVASRDFGGFGLGLWITRQIVEASGGKIEVRSTPGEGATFTVRLPCRGDGPLSEVRHAS
jgi:PAS domain S-box-containing protein